MQNKKRVLIIGLDTVWKNWVENFFESFDIDEIITNDALVNLIDNPPEEEILLVLCSHNNSELSPDEVAQIFQQINHSIPLYYLSEDRVLFDTVSLKTNGFAESFLLPLQKEFMLETLTEIKNASVGGRIYKSVSLGDLSPGESLDFDVFLFLPKNSKYVKYVNSGNSIAQKQLDNLSNHNQSSAYIDKKDTEKFYQFSAEKLKDVHSDKQMGETERKDKLRNSVVTIFSDLFSSSKQFSSLSARKSAISDAQKIVEIFIEDSGNKEIYEIIKDNIGQRAGVYSHESNVSLFASLFSIALDQCKPEHLSMAGLLHDIGKSELPAQLKNKKTEEMTSDELRQFSQYPKKSVNYIQNHSIPLPNEVLDAILQHRERWNGQGFPKAREANRIKPEARILAIADALDELTTPQNNQVMLSSLEALEQMQATNGFDPELLEEIIRMFKKQSSSEKLAS
jgi:HD-GYP domain-containing protein (c-di-GMP phosphodiesterase class II)